MGILDAFRLDGKVALVTGASRGLGQAIALGLAEAGADIAGLDRLSDCSQTCDEVTALGRRFQQIEYDLMENSPAQLDGVIQQVLHTFGRLDILVNNAGIIRRSPLLDFSEKDWDDVIEINLKAVFFLTQAAARAMVENRPAPSPATDEQGQSSRGKIINIASLLSFQGGILIPSYTAAKSGVAGLTRLCANELAPRGINVNAIAPGYMATDNTAPLRADPARAPTILQRIPAGRWGEPSDLKGTAVFLASAASDYMHGAIVPVDGGWLVR